MKCENRKEKEEISPYIEFVWSCEFFSAFIVNEYDDDKHTAKTHVKNCYP